MRSRAEVEAEVVRLKGIVENSRRMPRYRGVAIWLRISQLEWVLGIESTFDDE